MSSLKGGIGIKPLLQNTNLHTGHPPKIQISVPDTNLFKKFQKKNNSKVNLFCYGSDRVRNWRTTTTSFFHTLHCIFLFLSLNFSLILCSAGPLLPLFSLFSTFLLLSPLHRTPATKFVPYRSPGSLCQPTSPMPPRFSGHPSLNLGVHSIPPASAKLPPSTPRPFVTLSSWPRISGPLPPWLLPVPCLHQKAYRQP